jgi:hypothetical protein
MLPQVLERGCKGERAIGTPQQLHGLLQVSCGLFCQAPEVGCDPVD